MRRTTLTPEEIAKQDEFKRSRRAQGYALMPERDRGWAYLRDHKNGGRILMRWGMPGTVEDHLFILQVGKREVVLNAEEIGKFLRWV